MKLFWTSEAIQDRDEIYNYIEADNLVAALTLDEQFSEKSSSSVIHLNFGRSGRVVGTRELIVHRNYVMVYDVADDIVRILRVLHSTL